MQRYAIIVAGGSGSRMESELPKQFIKLNGKPILMHTISQYAAASKDIRIVVVLPNNQTDFWKEMCASYSFPIAHKIVVGGATRFHSVQNGLKVIEEEQGLVAIHDGVRPIVSKKIINDSFELAEKTGNAITVVPLKDSLRKGDSSGTKMVDRSKYWLVQTPQTFQLKLIKEAYQSDYLSTHTDDASVFEQAGGTIQLLMGDYKNIKITTPEDILIAEAFLNKDH